jgi:hypothetical protein
MRETRDRCNKDFPFKRSEIPSRSSTQLAVGMISMTQGA